ncbi:MAG: phosphate ABC transporter ATP-binding protein [Anaerolineales bacterium]|nr:phosphate ABC transporter ATP-binding protein [Anaerolineae bacterium]MCB9132826.1 phosphate ABC transporter ATP-binding protein [Anaerolineales bacterium]
MNSNQTNGSATPSAKYVLEVDRLNVHYGRFLAVRDIELNIERNKVTALIGPSGCGKSTVLRSINRMNDLVDAARIDGQVRFHGKNIYDADVDAAEVRRRIGMVFQKPNPFPKSIYDNIAWGVRVNGVKKNMDDIVEQALRGAALWDEVKDKLKQSGLSLSGGQQQRLCIARAIAIRPDIILMDEPASALDPIATLRIEELMTNLVKEYTIIIVTHNMQQAARISDYTGFFSVTPDRTGYLEEFGPTKQVFTSPTSQITEDYITGRFG